MAMAMGFQYLVLVWMVISCAMADKAKDREECTNELVGLATCLPYVGGQAKSPTPDCCSGLKQVLKDDKKCLCVIIRDRDDPELGLNINVTLALGLPSVCHASANVSQCPALLHLDPNSPEAQVFYQFGKTSNHAASSPAPSPTAGGSGNSISARSSKGTSDGWCSRKRWVELEIVSGVVLLLYFITS
ncbi:non-specific lipid transfer protein GPI-anchored 13-like [Mangifera indica]|uniref:non-specific lipid transfer protein GPI-anchored 13-like n=1 Tax=Mangifera indica TaxID=29780 RepID=UPI001CFBC968|nr:non-specific lipid transfer protein GPI-anchored 13-like [Mangifera indica]